MGTNKIELTQEFLSHMLGVRRTSVSLCAHKLQKSGLIKYARGMITIIDRKGLEERLRMLRRHPSAHRQGSSRIAHMPGRTLRACG
jgi:Mn-dependent DtxR family transcriptional regulator